LRNVCNAGAFSAALDLSGRTHQAASSPLHCPALNLAPVALSLPVTLTVFGTAAEEIAANNSHVLQFLLSSCASLAK
jgi:hypothetical protein